MDQTRSNSKSSGSKYSFSESSQPYRLRTITASSTTVSTNTITDKNLFKIPFTTIQRYITTTKKPTLDYCKLLNCNFNGWKKQKFKLIFKNF